MRLIIAPVLVAALTGGALAQPPARLDGGFFAAVSGDAAALKSAIDTAARTLATNPNDPEALVEHGMLTFLEIGRAGGRIDAAILRRLNEAVARMDRAAELEPDNVRVRILRGITFHQGSRAMPPAMAAPMLEKGRSDLQAAFDLQAGELDTLGDHRLGELLQIKADMESRSGLTAEAERTYGLIRTKLPGTEYAERAAEWMATRTPLPANRTTCPGCHVTP